MPCKKCHTHQQQLSSLGYFDISKYNCQYIATLPVLPWWFNMRSATTCTSKYHFSIMFLAWLLWQYINCSFCIQLHCCYTYMYVLLQCHFPVMPVMPAQQPLLHSFLATTSILSWYFLSNTTQITPAQGHCKLGDKHKPFSALAWPPPLSFIG